MSHPLLFLLAAMPTLMDLSCLSILRVVLRNVEKFSAALPTLTLESSSLSTHEVRPPYNSADGYSDHIEEVVSLRRAGPWGP